MHSVNNSVFVTPFCPRCGKLVREDGLWCPNCGFDFPAPLTQQSQPTQPKQPTAPPYVPPRPPSYPSARDTTRTLAILGYVSAALSLFIVPEVFGAVAIVLGAYTRRRGRPDGKRIQILGIVCMFVGLFFTAIFSLLDLLP